MTGVIQGFEFEMSIAVFIAGAEPMALADSGAVTIAITMTA